MFSLRIKELTDPKLFANFPEDPFSDILIITQSRTLHLNLAFLSIDSEFFDRLSNPIQPVDLSLFSQGPLMLVLGGLYGGVIKVKTVNELEEVLRIIQHLEIDDYKQKIAESLLDLQKTYGPNSPLFSIQMLEICLKHNIIKNFIKQVHLESNLSTLENPKYYLQLGKLSSCHLNELLLNYLSQVPGCHKTVNSILENYFNRRNYRPFDYLNQPQLQPLKQVWQEFHHQIPSKMASPSSKAGMYCSTRISIQLPKKEHEEKKRLQKLLTMPGVEAQNSNCEEVNSDEQRLSAHLRILEKENQKRDQTIKELQTELVFLQQKLKRTEPPQLNQLEDITLLQNVANSRKSKMRQVIAEKSINAENAFMLHPRQRQKLSLKSRPLFLKQGSS